MNDRPATICPAPRTALVQPRRRRRGGPVARHDASRYELAARDHSAEPTKRRIARPHACLSPCVDRSSDGRTAAAPQHRRTLRCAHAKRDVPPPWVGAAVYPAPVPRHAKLLRAFRSGVTPPYQTVPPLGRERSATRDGRSRCPKDCVPTPPNRPHAVSRLCSWAAARLDPPVCTPNERSLAPNKKSGSVRESRR
jgi:hypothetical protein